jgi:hypothetical protein
MPQKIHLLNTKNRPAVGRISILAELGLRPIQAEPVQADDIPQLLAAFAAKEAAGHAERQPTAEPQQANRFLDERHVEVELPHTGSFKALFVLVDFSGIGSMASG